uniref:Zonadhesin n=1 Tax=Graphocephala atropunctata TaxID=36148 RepID=A0A1B6MCA4_9HEMI
MAMVAAGLLLLSLLGTAVSAPVSTYDQRQQGELNIHAQLDNIVIVLIPTSNFNLLNLAGKTKYSGDKPGGVDKMDFLQIFQKPHKSDIDRYETVFASDQPQILDNTVKTEEAVPVVTSSQVIIDKDGQKEVEKEEEVVATVEEMKPESTEKTTDLPKSEATEDSPIKEHSTVSETMQESVLKVSVPEELKEAVKTTEKEASSHDSEKNPERIAVKSPEVTIFQEVVNSSGKKTENKLSDSAETVVPTPEKFEKNEEKVESAVEEKLVKSTSASSESDNPTIKDLIKPVAEKEEKQALDLPKKTEDVPASTIRKSPEPVRLVEGVRKEKVIRYKPETKWAPELVDLMGPTRAKPKDLEEKRFASLCSPGAWDSELKTCIMPGETRSRTELARFLEAMRFGIAIPAK